MTEFVGKVLIKSKTNTQVDKPVRSKSLSKSDIAESDEGELA